MNREKLFFTPTITLKDIYFKKWGLKLNQTVWLTLKTKTSTNMSPYKD